MEFVSLRVLSTKNENENYSSIIFAKPANFTFMLGECFSFRFPHETESKIFSFASSPTENNIIISYKRGISRFKKKLETVQVGDSMEVSLYGSQFRFDPNKSSLFIAGGIGITAFRSIIKYCLDKNLKTSIHLMFLNKDESFPFQHELENFKNELSSLKTTYIITSKEGRLTKEKLASLVTYNHQEIYLAGPPLMIDDTVDLLHQVGIVQQNIHTESFDGYFESV